MFLQQAYIVQINTKNLNETITNKQNNQTRKQGHFSHIKPIINNMLQSSWSIKLAEECKCITIAHIKEKCLVYQGVSAQLICQTANNVIRLPIRKDIIAIGVLQDNIIALLTPHQLSIVDFNNNEQLHTLQFENAQHLYISKNYIYVSCSSDLYCYTHQYQQRYVNHTHTNILFMIETQKQQLIIAFDDITMRKYKGVNVLYDYEQIVGIAQTICIKDSKVIVGTKEGALALYEEKKHTWKIRSAYSYVKVLICEQFDEKFIAARRSGTIEVRAISNGIIIQEIGGNGIIIDILYYNFRDQQKHYIVCTENQIKAYSYANQNEKSKQPLYNEVQATIGEINQLQKSKNNLLNDIGNIRQRLLNHKSQKNQQHPQLTLSAGVVYEDGLILNIRAKGGYISGLTFEQKIKPVLVQRSTEVNYKFDASNNVTGQINIQVLGHSSYSSQIYQVQTTTLTLLKFWKWHIITQPKYPIEGKVIFKLVQRNARYLKWIQQIFYMNLTPKQITQLSESHVMKLRFSNFYQSMDMEMLFQNTQGRVSIYCDCIRTLGQVVQDLVEYMSIKQLDSQLHFPKEKFRLKKLIDNIQALTQTKISISSEMTEVINTAKFMLGQAQSARIVGCMKDFKRAYGEIMIQNKQLITEIQRKNQNTQQLKECMKNLGLLISQTSNVRVGTVKDKIVKLCREAISKKNFPTIISLMESGLAGIS